MITTIYTQSGTVFEHHGPITRVDIRGDVCGQGARILECDTKITEAFMIGKANDKHFFIIKNKDYCKVSVIAVSSIDAIVVEE